MSRPPARPLQRTPRTPLLGSTLPVPDQGQAETHPPTALQPAASPSSPAAGPERFLSTRVPKDLHRRVRQASIDQDMPIREIIISAVTEWLERHQGS